MNLTLSREIFCRCRRSRYEIVINDTVTWVPTSIQLNDIISRAIVPDPPCLSVRPRAALAFSHVIGKKCDDALSQLI